MHSTERLFQVVLHRDQASRPSRWFQREDLARHYCDQFNANAGPDRAIATYISVNRPEPTGHMSGRSSGASVGSRFPERPR